MRLLYDLDGTIAHFNAKYDSLMDELYAHLPNIPRSKDQTTFDLWADRTEEERDAIRTVMNYDGFYRDLEPFDGAVEAIKEADALGHEVHFVSSPWTSNRTCAQDKFDWIATHFGDEWRDRLVLAKDKTIVSGDILFDDKHPIKDRERADWTQVFFDQPYNRGVPGLRLFSWHPDEWKGAIAAVESQRLAERLDGPLTVTLPVDTLNDIKVVNFS